jgi:hypothetical protein
VHHVDGGDIVNRSATSTADPVVERPSPRQALLASTALPNLQRQGGTPAVCRGPLAADKHDMSQRILLLSMTGSASDRGWCDLGQAPSA